MYSNGDDDIHSGHNDVIEVTNYYHIQQECHQIRQDYWDQFTPYRKVCEQSGIKLAYQKMFKKYVKNNKDLQLNK